MVIRDLKIEINQDEVLEQIDCKKGSDLYDEVLEEYEDIKDEVLSLCQPICMMEYGVIPEELQRDTVPAGSPVLYVLYSIGRGPSDYSTKEFAKGDYLKGMLSDAIADSALFSLEKAYAPYLKQMCAEKKMGIKRRLEAPGGIDMLAQKVTYEQTKAHEVCGMNISSGYMLNPIKSNALVYMLTDDESVFLHQHDCRNCDRLDCKGRRVPDIDIHVIDGEIEYDLAVLEKQSILDALMQYDPDFSAICGGKGTCGKCKIRIMKGVLPPSLADCSFFSEAEIKEGMRLSCQAYPNEPVTIALNFQGEESFRILDAYASEDDTPKMAQPDANAQYGIAIDIGTTTIAFALLDVTSDARIASYTTLNRQRQFGADVISRIKASTEGKKEELKKFICDDLTMGVIHVLEEVGMDAERISSIAIAGNTTMTHLLMGYDCQTLGEYPFTPVNVDLIPVAAGELFSVPDLTAQASILPGISTFVGGDIVSGLYDCNVDQKEEYALLIDLGTNGEIALGNKEKLFVTSTAAGPAFEGGNIEWGVGSIEGAISSVTLEGENPVVKTIGDKPPVGICGTGVIEAVSELVREEIIDETGCLDDDYFDDGYSLAQAPDGADIVLTQQDVREIQLAKAAVRAGVETLFLRYGINKEQVDTVYLAGGFGFSLDQEKAIEIGMLPEEFQGKIKTVGNSSLGGAVKFLTETDGKVRTSHIREYAQEINLSADKDFNRFYMDYMYFERG